MWLVTIVAGKSRHRALFRQPGMANRTFLSWGQGNLALRKPVTRKAGQIVHRKPVHLFVGMAFQTGRLVRHELMFRVNMTDLAFYLFIKDMFSMAVCFGRRHCPLRNSLFVTSAALLPWGHSSMGESDGVFTRSQVSPEALILLDNSYFVAFLADNIPMSARLQIHERVLYHMTRGTKVGIILGILIITVAVQKQGEYNDG